MNLIVIYEEFDRTDDTFCIVKKLLNDGPAGLAEAVKLVDAHPNAIVVHGYFCEVRRSKTEIIIPGRF